jgi:hypothetical protein
MLIAIETPIPSDPKYKSNWGPEYETSELNTINT